VDQKQGRAITHSARHARVSETSLALTTIDAPPEHRIDLDHGREITVAAPQCQSSHDDKQTQQKSCEAPSKIEPRVLIPFTIARFPINGQSLPHNEFRKAVGLARRAGLRTLRRVFREQLLRCDSTKEILRMLALAMQKPDTRREMARMSEAIVRALYRSRINDSDKRVLTTINIIVGRLQSARLEVEFQLFRVGLRFAARARSLPGMMRYLKEFRECDIGMTKSLFRRIIAKCSVGVRGLGEIRNGRWKRDELLQVLLGSGDVAPHDAYHFETFMDRSDWQCLKSWLTILSRCKAVDQLHKEWDLWCASDARLNPKRLHFLPGDHTTKSRGDHWFVVHLCFAGDIKKAWEVLQASDLSLNSVGPPVRNALLDCPEYVPHWTTELRASMLEKYDHELRKIEDEFGAKWISTGPDGHGYHLIPANFDNEAWERISDPLFLQATPHGYPWEADALETERQREINEAKEVEYEPRRS